MGRLHLRIRHPQYYYLGDSVVYRMWGKWILDEVLFRVEVKQYLSPEERIANIGGSITKELRKKVDHLLIHLDSANLDPGFKCYDYPNPAFDIRVR